MEITGHLFERLHGTWQSSETAAPWPLLTLGVADLEHLVEAKLLRPAPNSPLAPLLGPFPRSTAAEREQAAERLRLRELLPTTSDGGAEAGELSPFRHSLEIVARPEATLTVRFQSGDSYPALIPLFLAGGIAAPAFVDSDGLHLGMPLDKDHIVESIQNKLLEEIPPELESPVTVSRLALRAVEILWPGTGRPASELIPHWLAFSALAQQLPEPGHVSALLEAVVGEGVVEELIDGYRLSSRYLPWVEPWLSGEGCTIDYCPLAEAGDEAAKGRHHRLSFYGAPGHWVVGTPDLAAAVSPSLDEAGRRRPDLGLGAPWWRPETAAAPDACDRWTFAAPPARALGWHLGRLLGG